MMNRPALLALVLLASGAAVLAEDAPLALPATSTPRRIMIRPKPIAIDGQPLDAPKKESQPRFDLDFKGGKLPEFLKATAAALKTVSNEPLNVIVPTESENVEVPAVHLRQISLRDLFAAMGSASKKQVLRAKPSYPGEPMPPLAYQLFEYSWSFEETAEGTNVWIFHLVDVPPAPPLSPAPSTQVWVSQLGSLLEKGLTVADITTAIQTAWKVGGIDPAPELKFHPETGLLITSGTLDALNDVAKVLDGLKNLPPKAQAASPTPTK